MANKIIRQLFNQFQPGLELTAIIESASDLHDIPVCAPGSRAYVIGGEEYEMGVGGAWLSKSSPFSKPITVTLGSALSYTGSELTQTVTSVKNGNATLTLNTDYEISGNKATEPGVYYLSIIGKGSYSGIHIVPFTVSRASLTKPTKTSATYTYNGTEQTLALNNFDSAKMSASGNKHLYPGAHTAIVDIKDKTHYMWSVGASEDEDDSPVSISWSIGKAALTKPTKSANKTYTGEELTVTLTNFDAEKMTVRGNKATEPGDYTAVVDIALKQFYKWTGAQDDDTDTEISIAWTVNKANGSVTVDPNALTVAVGESKTSAITALGTGALTAQSSAASKASAEVVGNTVKVTGVASGSATVTVSAAADEHYKAASATVTVTVS